MAEESGPRAFAKRKVGPLPVWGYAVLLVVGLLVWRFYSGRGKVSEGEGNAEALGPSSELAGPISPEAVIINPAPNISVTIPSAPPLASTTTPTTTPVPTAPVGKWFAASKTGRAALTDLATRYGPMSSESLWGHPANAALRAKLGNNPTKIAKGERIFVPGPKAAAAGKK